MSTSTGIDLYTPTRPIMTRDELAAHHVTSYGRDFTQSDDGYDDMEVNERKGWKAIPVWGRDGYNLGEWPYVVISHGTRKVDAPGPGRYRLLSVCEGDHEVYAFDSVADRDAATDYLFVWYGLGKGYDTWEVKGLTGAGKREALDAGTLRVPISLRGPFSWARCDVTTGRVS